MRHYMTITSWKVSFKFPSKELRMNHFMKTIILPLFLLFFLFPPINQAQDKQKIDSLLAVYNNEQSADSSKLDAAKKLFNAYLYYDQEQAGIYLSQAYDLAVKTGDENEIASYHGSKGILMEMNGQLDSAKVYYWKAIKTFEKLKDRNKLELTRFNLGMIEFSQGNIQTAIDLMEQNINPPPMDTKEYTTSQGISYGLLGRIYSNQGYYQLALKNALMALKIIESTGEELRIADALNDLANTESALAHYQKSIDYQNKAIAIYKKHGDKYYMANSKNNVGSTYLVLKDYPNAVKNLKESLALAKEVGSKGAEISALTNLGQTFTEQGKYDRALDHLQLALAKCKEDGRGNVQSEVEYVLGKLYSKSGQYTKALSYLNQSIAYADSVQKNHLLQDLFLERANTYESKGSFQAALADYKEFHSLSDTIYDGEQIAAIEELRIIHDLETKEQKIELLAKNAEIDAIKKTRLWTMLLAAIGIGGILLWAQWQKRRKEKLLHQKQQEIESQKRKVAELENERLNHELDFKKQELTSKVLQLCRKNEFLQSLNKDVKDFKSEFEGADKNYFDKLSRKINRDMDVDTDWQQFLKSFESVHPNFKKILFQKYPNLAPNEIRMAYLMRMNLESKDIANLLNITNDGVKKARYRMRKKMGKDSAINLTAYFLNLEA